MRKAFEPKVSIVTGAASGIGRAIAAELVARGSRVVVADLDADGATRAAAELGPLASAATLDVADAAAVTALVQRVTAEHGRLDVMVNNAGIAIGGLLEELDERHWDKALAVNLRGVINGVTAAYEVMRAQGSGHILNTASLAGLIPAPAMLPYTTTKHAVVGLSTALRAEAASQGVRVSVLCPGFVDTPLLDDVYAAPASFGGSSVRARVRLLQPRFLTPEQTAKRAVDGLAANKAVIPVGFLAHLTWRTLRYAPPVARAMIQGQATGHRRLNERAARRAASR
ncbi:NADP-dependent 3-hydroxy acid dehydrogenase YdfG [Pedococcus dokdonensis]|uniref:NADP-dependent 3-hydroxy acid dehydrogenase YdfG n=1 Tax=Pedococcus dokdonensis TaxID=443156 RepID=A0A1H0S6L0_9MICO|nr:SDR family oxidoreductase [Pedococcus dokdonensis]SDP37354.1 NADP-dependent 3-hydroxy acid dehydrogenase YdfG [Pedococcus dokdonensis]